MDSQQKIMENILRNQFFVKRGKVRVLIGKIKDTANISLYSGCQITAVFTLNLQLIKYVHFFINNNTLES